MNFSKILYWGGVLPMVLLHLDHPHSIYISLYQHKNTKIAAAFNFPCVCASSWGCIISTALLACCGRTTQCFRLLGREAPQITWRKVCVVVVCNFSRVALVGYNFCDCAWCNALGGIVAVTCRNWLASFAKQ